ncbi:hypothetical protein A1Q1_00942 [Trichosporon asahii var. asahii CBS 2479]|uniref:Bromo domain-containing protein n=1 Tax=Trichosporon asahii var. asahii (strain ATCC 90039 / CBS 2479 / JCM 2466 / KCTC 7840 / NBRC 103889/ NCYC 2677 / UAMH 7654) TaxID=1186058 RepID=J6EZ25_TRIAS|nr:hypothetical protein A1Q1_00942 [Trichosporon asahii var. asahii CBS 2479]EJT49929.1 hypothetical protein A1Q1_00942 [Trichosporon asahii var. asahii CBS 2479]
MAVAVDKMTVQDKLLLAQAVYKTGASNWTVVMPARLTVRPAPDGSKPQAKVHLQLAQTFYVARMQELKDKIMGYEARFTELMSDINGIKAGEIDDKIQAEIRAALNRKYGKKLVDSWVPDPAEVKKVAEAGPESAKTPEPATEPAIQKDSEDEKPGESADADKAGAEESAEKREAEAAEAAPVETEPTPTEVTPNEPEAMDVDEAPEAPTKELTAEPEGDAQEASAGQSAEGTAEASTVERSQEPEKEPTAEPTTAEDEAKVQSAESPREPSAEAEPGADRDKEDGEGDQKDEEDNKEEEEEAEEEKPTTRSSRRKPRKSTPSADKKDGGDKKNDIDIEEQAATPNSEHGSEALSDVELSPLPADESATADAPPSSPTPASKRGRKRKGETVPKVGRPPKRGRKGSSAVDGDDAEGEENGDADAEEPEKEVKEEVQEEAEEETPRGRRGRRRRGESPAKEASPPAKRGASVSSTASGTPQTEGRSSRRTRQPRGSMRDDVVSKSVRAASEAISVKEEEEEKKDDHSEEEAEGEKRSTRSRRKAEAAASAASTPVEKRTSKRTRTPRPAARESAGGEADDEDDSGPSASVSTPASSVAPPSTKSQKTMQKLLLQLLDSIQQHKYGPVFANPVRKAADYYEIIKRPMDLKTLRARIKDGSVGNIEEFERDVRLMFANATIYNGRGSQVSDMAKEMMAASEVHIAHFKSMQHHLGR